MKIGIMTFHAAPNHGAVLQAFALQTQLLKMEHEPYFINYQHGNQLDKGVLGWIGRTPGNTFEKFDNQFKARPFVSFRERHIHIGLESYFDHSQLVNNPPEADVYVCGSDQVWNSNLFSKEKDEHAFWLNFGGNNVRRIAYAASFGVKEINDTLCGKYAKLARRFDAIGVREKDAVKLLEKLGRKDGVWVPDPTLLLDPDEYLQIEPKHQQLKRSYLFSYQLKTRRSLLSSSAQINAAVCSTLGLDLYESYSTSFLYNILHRRYLNPGQWLNKLHNSNFIVTNSFHGTVFGLLFKRPFITILRKGGSSGMNSRIESLLEMAGLQHRAVTDFDRRSIEELCREEIDWSQADAKIQGFREIGQQFLSDALR